MPKEKPIVILKQYETHGKIEVGLDEAGRRLSLTSLCCWSNMV